MKYFNGSNYHEIIASPISTSYEGTSSYTGYLYVLIRSTSSANAIASVNINNKEIWRTYTPITSAYYGQSCTFPIKKGDNYFVDLISGQLRELIIYE